MANVAAIREGSLIMASSGGFSVSACDVWGMADQVLIYFTEAGTWLSSELGYANTSSYAAGYHLFSVRVLDGGPCMTAGMCGQAVELDEVPLAGQLTVDLRSPDAWCN